MFFSQMNEEMEEAQVFARCGVLLSSNERKERGQNEPRDASWWASGYRNRNDFAFKKRFRVKRDTFDFLVQEVRHLLQKQPTRMNPEPVIPEKQLAICLYRLAHGSSYSTVGDLFGVAESTAAVIFNDVCRVLVTTLYDRYVNLPKSADEWKHELKNFLQDWEFPCVGAWDGFHVYVSTKLKSFYSFKKRYSVSSMGFIRSNKSFLWAAVGAPGSTHDSRLLKSCSLYNEIQNKQVC